MRREDIKNIIESILFAHGDPISVNLTSFSLFINSVASSFSIIILSNSFVYSSNFSCLSCVLFSSSKYSSGVFSSKVLISFVGIFIISFLFSI